MSIESGKKRILQKMEWAMRARGWPARKLGDLPQAYAKNTVVTPYFFCSQIALRAYGSYVIEGAIGIIHQGFEMLWQRNESRTPREPGFGVILNTANVPELADTRYIAKNGEPDKEVDIFCSAVAGVLEKMPCDEAALVRAYKQGKLAGHSFETFAGYSYRSKFGAFSGFVSHLENYASESEG